MATKTAKIRSVEILQSLQGNTLDSTRFHDLCISVWVCDFDENRKPIMETSTKIATFGGQWDRKAKAWSGNAKRTLPMRFHRGQEHYVRYLCEWLKRRVKGSKGPQWEDFKRFWSLLLLGGRRGGKSHAAVATVVLCLVLFPGQDAWFISPRQEETDELEQAFLSMIPHEWYEHRGAGLGKVPTYTIANGSRVMLISGYKPEKLKRGRVFVALYNEAQKMTAKGWAQLRGAISDNGGMVLIVANPPDTQRGVWIEEIHERSMRGENFVKTFLFDPTLNPMVERQALADMEKDLNDPIAYQREMLGVMGLAIGEVVMHQFRQENIRKVPHDYIDVTHEITERELGRKFDFVAGVDLQKTPHMPVVFYKFFVAPGGAGHVMAWAVDSVVPEDCDEHELVGIVNTRVAWTRNATGRDCYRGSDSTGGEGPPTLCAFVLDASAWWQDSAHNVGKQSDRIFRQLGWSYLYRPQRSHKRNPDIVERFKVTNWLCRSAEGTSRLFVDPDNGPVIIGMRKYPMKNGFPQRSHNLAHIMDAATYPLFLLFAGAKGVRRPLAYQSGKTFGRTKEMAGF